MNDSGEWMVDWCMQYEMTVCNTLFKKRDVHMYMWVRRVRGEILESALVDYMCISGKCRARVTGVNVLRAAGGVHFDLKPCGMQSESETVMDTCTPNREVREVLKVEKLKDAGYMEEFEDGIKEGWLAHREREL